MQETPNLKKLCEDDDFLAFMHKIIDQDEDKWIIHVDFKVNVDKRIVEKTRNVMALIDEILKEKGLKKLYTWAEKEEQEKFNQFLGFTLTGREVNIEGYFTEQPIYEYVKEL